MTTHERLTVVISAEIAAALRRTVAEGGYASPSDIVREALEDWARQRGGEESDPDSLRGALRVGLESGPAVPAEPFFAEWRARYASKV